MPSKVKQKYWQLLVGASIMLVALLLFVVGMGSIVRFPPVTLMEYIMSIFAILGINFGRSSGKTLAYTIHDRDIILERIQGHGRVSSEIGRIMSMPIMFTAFTLIAWTLFVIGFSLSKSIVVDTVLIGYVRWVMIFSMVIMIFGSYFFYKGRSLGKDHMLTFKGRVIMEHSSRVVGEVMQAMDRTENRGRNIIHQTGDVGRDMIDHAEDRGRDILNRVKDGERKLVDMIRRKF